MDNSRVLRSRHRTWYTDEQGALMKRAFRFYCMAYEKRRLEWFLRRFIQACIDDWGLQGRTRSQLRVSRMPASVF